MHSQIQIFNHVSTMYDTFYINIENIGNLIRPHFSKNTTILTLCLFLLNGRQRTGETTSNRIGSGWILLCQDNNKGLC